MNILMLNGAATALWLFILTRLDTYRRDKRSTSRIMVFYLTGLLSVISTLLLYFFFPFHLIRTNSWVLTSLLNQVLPAEGGRKSGPRAYRALPDRQP